MEPVGTARITRTGLLAAGAALAFIAISAWWVFDDTRVPNGDAGRHMVIAWNYLQALGDGHLSAPLKSALVIDDEFYPPVVHLVGVAGAAVAGYDERSLMLADNLVFVPLLALGTYGAGSVVFDRRAGLLAVLFVLGMPILISQFHVFMLDAPLLALTAVSVWLLLVSNRFERLGISALAGLAVGLGTMTKVTFPLFVLGLIAVMLLRGGWRNWHGVVVFAAVAVLVSQPWLLFHWDLLRDRADRATAGPTSPHATGTFGNYGAYFWSLFETQLLLPLTAFAATGLVLTVRSWLRERTPDQAPELVAGLAVAFVCVASMSWFNDRYSMPYLVYLAILGTGWISGLAPLRRAVATGLLALVVLTNTLMVNTGAWHRVDVQLPVSTHVFTLVSDWGYVEAEPKHSDVLPMLEAAADDGIDRIAFDGPSLNTGGFNLNGMSVYAFTAGLDILPQWEQQNLGPNGLYMFRALPKDLHAAGCLEHEGYGIYMSRGGGPGEGRPLYCPPRAQWASADR